MAEWLEKAPCNTRLPSSNPAQATLQKSNLFEITVVAEDHEPNIGSVPTHNYFRKKKWRGSR